MYDRGLRTGMLNAAALGRGQYKVNTATRWSCVVDHLLLMRMIDRGWLVRAEERLSVRVAEEEDEDSSLSSLPSDIEREENDEPQRAIR